MQSTTDFYSGYLSIFGRGEHTTSALICVSEILSMTTAKAKERRRKKAQAKIRRMLTARVRSRSSVRAVSCLRVYYSWNPSTSNGRILKVIIKFKRDAHAQALWEAQRLIMCIMGHSLRKYILFFGLRENTRHDRT